MSDNLKSMAHSAANKKLCINSHATLRRSTNVSLRLQTVIESTFPKYQAPEQISQGMHQLLGQRLQMSLPMKFTQQIRAR